MAVLRTYFVLGTYNVRYLTYVPGYIPIRKYYLVLIDCGRRFLGVLRMELNGSQRYLFDNEP